MEKPENLYVRYMDVNCGGRGVLEGKGAVQGGGGYRGEKNWDNCNSIINKIYF